MKETTCTRCDGLGVVYVSLTESGAYWNTADCPKCAGTGAIIQNNKTDRKDEN